MRVRVRVAYTMLLLSLTSVVSVAAVTRSPGTVTYYISSTSGNDGNDGTSPEKAWRHLSEIFLKSTSTAPFQPGDNILLKRGDQWNEQIRMQAHGTDRRPITIGAYGQGSKPLLYGDDNDTHWDTVPGHIGTYTTDMGPGSVLGALVSDGKMIRTIYPSGPLQRREDMDTFVDSLRPGILAGQFEGRLWVRMADGKTPNGSVRIFRLAGVSLSDSSYVQIEDLDIERFYTGVDIENARRVIIHHNDIQDVLGIGIYLRSGDTDCRVESNTVFRSGNTALYVLKGSHNTFRDNWVSHVNTTILGITVHGDGMGIGLQESQHTLIERNYFAYSGGIDFYYEQGSTVRYNYLYRVRSAGSPHGIGLSIYGNIYNLSEPIGQTRSRGINAVATGPGTIAVFNNTIFNASGFFLMGSALKGGKVIFSDNIAASTFTGSAMAVFGANVTSNHNCFFTPGEPVFSYSRTDFSSLRSYQAASDLDADSIFSDPGFLSAAPITPLDFRIRPTSGCNSPASNSPFVYASDGRTYDQDHDLPDSPVIGALQGKEPTTQIRGQSHSCAPRCFGQRFFVPSGVYLVRLKFEPRALSRTAGASFALNNRRITAEFDPSALADPEDLLSRYFLVRAEGGSITLDSTANTSPSLITEVDVLPFDASHGEGPQVIPW
jgi:hypothetical protein